MKILRLIIFSIIFLSLVLTIISLFIPSDVRISKVININTVAANIWPQLNDMRNWMNWYPGMKDSATQNFISLDSSNGRITKTSFDKTIIALRQQKKDELVADIETGKRHMNMGWNIISYPQSDFITLQWHLDFHLKWYPWQKFSSLLFEKIYGHQMEKSLSDLKAYIENHSSKE